MSVLIIRFPLFKLPYLARMHVIKQMDISQKVGLTMCSKTTKECVTFMLKRSRNLRIWLTEEPKIVIDQVQLKCIVSDLDSPCIPVSEDSSIIWNVPPLKIRTWILHLMQMYRASGVDLTFFDECERFPIKHVKTAFGGFKITALRTIGSRIPAAYHKKILKSFRPSNVLHLDRNPFDDESHLQKFLCPEYDQLNLLRVPVTLDGILTLRATNIQIMKSWLKENELNKIFKEWKSGWNLNLKYMMMKVPRTQLTDEYFNNILKDLEYATIVKERSFKSAFHCSPFHFKTTYDIQRFDGIRGSLVFTTYGSAVDIEFLIW